MDNQSTPREHTPCSKFVRRDDIETSSRVQELDEPGLFSREEMLRTELSSLTDAIVSHKAAMKAARCTAQFQEAGAALEQLRCERAAVDRALQHVLEVRECSSSPAPAPLEGAFNVSSAFSRTPRSKKSQRGVGKSSSAMPAPPMNKPSDFRVLGKLGRGAFGTVLKVARRCDNMTFAMKVLHKAEVVKADQVSHTIAERNALLLSRRAHHPFLVGLHAAFQSKSNLYMVMDYMACGELYRYLKDAKRFSEARTRCYAAEVLLAIEHLHLLLIVHRDLKPENILVDAEGHIKVTDFGLCKERIKGLESKAKSFCGTPEYMAPEVLLRTGHGKSVDWWCFGILIFEMLTGVSPFFAPSLKRTYLKICRGDYTVPPAIEAELSRSAVTLISSLLTTTPALRMGCGACDAEEIKSHPFFGSLNWKQVQERKLAPVFVPPPITETKPTTEALELDFFEEKEGSHFFGFTYSKGATVTKAMLQKSTKAISSSSSSNVSVA